MFNEEKEGTGARREMKGKRDITKRVEERKRVKEERGSGDGGKRRERTREKKRKLEER